MQEILKDSIKDLDLNDINEVNKLQDKRDRLVKERRKIKEIAISLWEMQNHEIKLVEKDYEISNMTWTDIVFRGTIVGTIEKPKDMITSEDMKCILEKRANIMSYFPYSRINEIYKKGFNASKSEKNELKEYKNYIKTYKFWEYAEPYFSQAVNTFKNIVDDENCKVFLKESVKLKNMALKDNVSDEYQHFLYANHKVALKATKDNRSEFVGGNNCYKRELYLNNMLIRTTYDTRKHIAFEDLTYLLKSYKDTVDAYNISLYSFKKNSLEKDIVKAEQNGNFIKTFKLKTELKKLNKKHEKLNNDYEFWKNNKYIISNVLLDYYNLDKNESAISKIDKEIKQIDDKLNNYDKAKEKVVDVLNNLSFTF